MRMIDRFMSKVEPEPNSGCWIWMANAGTNYGQFWLNGKHRLAHRVAYELFKGPIPPGLVVMHKCDVKCCVNPEHISVGTLSDNTQDMYSKGRAKPPVGERNGQAKIGASEVAEIRARLARGEFQKDIAADYGLSQSAVSFINLRKKWAHVA